MNNLLAELARGWSDHTAELEGQRQVLVVDDEPDAGGLFKEILGLDGFPADLAASAEEALVRLERGRYAVVLIDKNLPGMDGISAIAKIHERDPDCETILITGYGNFESVRAAIDLRVVDYLAKPLPDITILPAAVSRALTRRRRRLLARRMLTDLRDAVLARASAADAETLAKARSDIEAFRSRLRHRRIVITSSEVAAEAPAAIERLNDNGFGVVVETNAARAMERCAAGKANAVLVGPSFGEVPVLKFFDQLLEVSGYPELVLVGDPSAYDTAVAALRRGAAGFLVRPLDPELLVQGVERACFAQHERLYHYKLVTELHRILGAFADRAASPPQSADDDGAGFSSPLSSFDVQTARKAIALYGLSEDVES